MIIFDDTKTEIVLAIIGSRTFGNFEFAENKINFLIEKNNFIITKIVSGGAVGADMIAELYAIKYNIPINVIKPNWNLGKHAGFLRNTAIINECDYVINFWDGKSKGTKDSIDKAKKMNKQVSTITV